MIITDKLGDKKMKYQVKFDEKQIIAMIDLVTRELGVIDGQANFMSESYNFENSFSIHYDAGIERTKRRNNLLGIRHELMQIKR